MRAPQIRICAWPRRWLNDFVVARHFKLRLRNGSNPDVALTHAYYALRGFHLPFDPYTVRPAPRLDHPLFTIWSFQSHADRYEPVLCCLTVDELFDTF